MQPASQVRTYSMMVSYWPRALLTRLRARVSLTRSAAAVSANSAARAMMLAARSPAMLVHSYPSPLKPSLHSHDHWAVPLTSGSSTEQAASAWQSSPLPQASGTQREASPL